MTDFNLPNKHPQDRVAELPLTVGLATLETQILHEPPVRHTGRTVLAVAAAAAVVAGVGFGTWTLTRPDAPAGTQVATDPTSSGAPQPTQTQAPQPAPTTVVLPQWRTPDRILSMTAPTGWETYQPSGNAKDFSLSWRRTGQEQYFSIDYQNADDFTRYTMDSCCEADQYTQVSKTTVLGVSGIRVIGNGSQAIYLPVTQGYGVTISSTGTSVAEFDLLLAALQWTNRAGVDATLPGAVPSTDLAGEVKVLLGRTAAPGGPLEVNAAGPHGRYSLAHAVLAAAQEAWMQEYFTALDAGNNTRMDEVTNQIKALGHSSLAREAEMDTDPIEDQLSRAMELRFTRAEMATLRAPMQSSEAEIAEHQQLLERLK